MALPGRFRGFFASRRAVAVAALVCIALMLVSVNIIAARLFTWRLDLTGQHLYTLSHGTLRTLSKIDEPITLRFYYSARLTDEVPSYGVYAQRVRELLDQYAWLRPTRPTISRSSPSSSPNASASSSMI